MKKRILTPLLLIALFLMSWQISFAEEEKVGIINHLIEKTKPAIEEQIIRTPKKMVPPKIIKGVYLTAGTISSQRGKDIVNLVKEKGGNAVVIDIEHGGGQFAFVPKNEFLKNINPGSNTFKDIKNQINELHKNGIYAIARQVVFNDPYTSTRKPEWRIKNIWGGTFDYRWLDPSKAGVQLFNLYTLMEVAEMGFDEVQFDYIRFPATNHNILDYNFDEEKFTRAEVITDFLKKARFVANSYGIKLSVDVFGAIVWGDIDWKTVGQDTVEIAKQVDAIYPMTYPSHVSPGYFGHNNPYGAPYSFIYDSIDHFVKKADGNAEIRTWVQGFPLKIPNFGSWFMEEQVKASFDAGAQGFIVWSPGNYYTYSWPAMGMEPEPKEITNETEPNGYVTTPQN